MKLPQVKEVMGKSVAYCSIECTIEDAAKLMVEKDTRVIIIKNKIGNPIGLVTGGDIVKAIAQKLTSNTKVEEITSKELITVESETDIIDAAQVMKKKGIKRLAVTDKGKLSGILTANDVLKYSPKYLHEFSVTLDKLDTIFKKL
jgi:predicted transcriptional regulator